MTTILTIVFDLLVTPIAASLRGLGLDVLRLQPTSGATYWRRRTRPVRLRSRL